MSHSTPEENSTVEEFFDIDEDTLHDMSKEKEDYWDGCSKFYSEIKNTRVDLLTPKQRVWLEKIESDMEAHG